MVLDRIGLAVFLLTHDRIPRSYLVTCARSPTLVARSLSTLVWSAHFLAGLGAHLLCRHLLGGRFRSRRVRCGGTSGPLRRALFRRRPLGTLLCEQLGGTFGCDRFDVVAAPQGCIDLAVGDIGPEAALLDDHGTTGGRINAEVLQRRLGRSTSELLGLG